MCKKPKFNHTNPAPVLENDTHNLLWDFNIQRDHLIPARRPDFIIINTNKKTCKIVAFAVPVHHRIKLKECEKKDKYLELARELKKIWNMNVTIIPILIGAFGTETKGLLKGLEELEFDEWRPSKREHYWQRSEYWEEYWRLEETSCQSFSREEHQLTLMWKTLKE